MQSRVVTHLQQAGQSAGDVVGLLKEQLLGATPALILIFSSPQRSLNHLVTEFCESFPEAAVLGASSAGQFTEANNGQGIASIVALAGDFRVHTGMGSGLKCSAEQAVAEAVDSLPTECRGFPYKTALMLLDPLAGNGEEVALLTVCRLGNSVTLVGGAAADDLAMEQTEVACGQRVLSDALAVAMIFSKKPLGVGVCHGHEPLSKPLTVTRARDNIVFEVDGRPAWEVWKEETRSIALAAGIDVDTCEAENIRAYLLRYEAGLQSKGGYKIRAPLSLGEDGELYFACGIPEGSVIQITESSRERQIESARRAAQQAREQLQDNFVSGAIVFDCICRRLILKEDFSVAVNEISHQLGDVPLAGFETYGEIALHSGDLSGFHNSTTVVLALP